MSVVCCEGLGSSPVSQSGDGLWVSSLVLSRSLVYSMVQFCTAVIHMATTSQSCTSILSVLLSQHNHYHHHYHRRHKHRAHHGGGFAVLLTLMMLALALTIDAENLDIATDEEDQPTEEFTVDNSAGSYGRKTVIIIVVVVGIVVVMVKDVVVDRVSELYEYYFFVNLRFFSTILSSINSQYQTS